MIKALWVKIYLICFTTFNKYVGKADKNQALLQITLYIYVSSTRINRNSKVLDPCCGSGAFFVRAKTEAMDDCSNNKERETFKKKNIYGIEYEENAFGLSTTNMLIHSDGNSNIRQGNCFEMSKFIEEANINIVLMNPPFNAQRKHCRKSYVKNWDSKLSRIHQKDFNMLTILFH